MLSVMLFVTPKLNAVARRYAESIVFCDLRWGVDTTELETDDGARKVLSVCLNEIDNSKPYIIVLIGDRYGWLPNQNFIYDAAKQKNFYVNSDEKISVTELEIQYGALHNLDNAIFYFRNIVGDIPAQYHDDYLNDENADKLQHLKNSIDKLGSNAVIRHYNLSWSDETKSLSDGLDKFCDMVEQDIKKFMEQEWQKRKSWSIYELDQHLQWDFAQQKSHQYVDHDDLSKSCIKILSKNKNMDESYYGLLAINGKSGTGKTTLLSHLALILKKNLGFEVLTIFCGLTSSVCTAGDVLRYMINFIERKLDIPHFESVDNSVFSSNDGHIQRFSMLINQWTHQTKRKLIFIIDAVDQLNDDRDKENLIFIPKNLSNQVRMIFSYSDELNISEPFNTIHIKYLNSENKIAIIEGITKSLGKSIGQPVVTEICKIETSNNPLYLSLLIQRLEMMHQTDFEKINALAIELKKSGYKNPGMSAINQIQFDIVHNCSNDLEEFCRELVNFSTKNFGDFVKLAVKYIAVSRYGLREEDLSEILKSQGVQWNALNFSIFTNYLSNFFIQRADGRIDFSHKIIRKGIEKSISNRGEYHKQILNYLQLLDSNASIYKQEFLFHCIKADDKKTFVQYINKIVRDNLIEYMKNEYNTLHLFYDLVIKSSVDWFCELVGSIRLKNISYIFSPMNRDLLTDKNSIWCSVKEVYSLIIFSNNCMAIDSVFCRSSNPIDKSSENKFRMSQLYLAKMLALHDKNDIHRNLRLLLLNLTNYGHFITDNFFEMFDGLDLQELKYQRLICEGAIDLCKILIATDDNDSIEIYKSFAECLKNLGRLYSCHSHIDTIRMRLRDECVDKKLRADSEKLMFQSLEYLEKVSELNPSIQNTVRLAEGMFEMGYGISFGMFSGNIQDKAEAIANSLYWFDKSKSKLDELMRLSNFLKDFKPEISPQRYTDSQNFHYCFINPLDNTFFLHMKIINTYKNLSGVYQHINIQDYKKAWECIEYASRFAFSLCKQVPGHETHSQLASIFENKASLYVRMSLPNYLKAIEYYRSAIAIRIFLIDSETFENNDIFHLIEDYRELGRFFAFNGDYNNAQKNFETAVEIALEISENLKNDRMVVEPLLSELYETIISTFSEQLSKIKDLSEEIKNKRLLEKNIQKYVDLENRLIDEAEQRYLITRNEMHHTAYRYYTNVSQDQISLIDKYLEQENYFE